MRDAVTAGLFASESKKRPRPAIEDDTMATTDDTHHLRRFVDAQEGEYAQVCKELRAGQKRSHWIWFIFPQMKGLGKSATADHYGIASRQEAEAYLAHSVLGARLRECTALVLQVEGRSIEQIFGFPDNLKFRSSMTLFAEVGVDSNLFQDALEKYFSGKPDQLTLNLLRNRAGDLP
jgi:uncharacterized protein (DUF1810 family)